MAPKILRFFAPTLFVLNAGIIVAVWFTGSASVNVDGTVGGLLIAMGGLAGLVAFYLVLWQLLLIGRVGWIERAWGHDKLSHAHHLGGLLAVVFIGIHPVLLILGYSAVAQTTMTGQFMQFLTGYQDVLRAFIAYLLFLGIVGISLTIVRQRLRYETWYFVHITLYLAIILSFGHQMANGHDFGRVWFGWYWQFLFYATLATVAWYRVVRPVIDYFRYGFRVQGIEPVSHNVTSVIISGRGLNRLHARAGQFIIVRFFTRGLWRQAHPFSLSEMPDGKRLRLTIKAMGDFTAQVPMIPVGTKVLIEGPLGRFTADRASHDRIVLIAGGIGITPLRALFEQFVREGKTVDLIYAARSEQDFALRDELEGVARTGGTLRLMPQNTVGHLSAKLLGQAVPDISSRYVYLCGPPAMMRMVRHELATLGVPARSVLFERFALG